MSQISEGIGPSHRADGAAIEAEADIPSDRASGLYHHSDARGDSVKSITTGNLTPVLVRGAEHPEAFIQTKIRT